MHALVEHIETTTSDGFTFRGGRFSRDAETVPTFSLVHVHGMSGGGLDNAFVWKLGEAVAAAGGEFITGDNRGSAGITYFLRDGSQEAERTHVGSIYEDLAESPIDIAAWLTKARSSSVYLSGHSLGTVKVTLAVGTREADVKGLILLAPADMVALQQASTHYDAMHAQAQQAVAQGNSRQILDYLCGDWTMISARTALNIGTRGAPGDIINGQEVLHSGPAANVNVPTLIVIGSTDISMVGDAATACEIFKQTLETSSPDVQLHVIQGGDHGFSNTADELSTTILNWIERHRS